MKEKVIKKYQELFNTTDTPRTFFAPGRVNLIGEHTDYNGGHVLPCALTIGTYAAVLPREDEKILFYSMNFEEQGVIERNINETEKDPSKSFTDYPVGVIHELKKAGYKIENGFNIVYFGNIPNQSGLSSSASVEVLTGFIAKTLYDLDLSNIDIALIGQKAENNFIGVNCGIMDQFIIAMGKENHATYLDTSTLDFEYIPVNLQNQSLVIACSNKKRGLGESKYNERRAECEKAVEIINKASKKNCVIKFLGELTEEPTEIDDEIIRKRARHAVLENQRTIKACKALQNNQIDEFGKLMNDSHLSLQKDYEVTGKELDTLVYASWKQKGCVGSRMTGAGFGGCTVSIVNNEDIDAFIENVGKEYREKTDYIADFYVVKIGGGPKEI